MLLRLGWRPPRVEEFVTEERGGHWLCLNPAVPGWIVTTKAGCLTLGLADGVRTVGDIVELLRSRGLEVAPDQVASLFEEADHAHLFDSPPATDIFEYWSERKLTAIHLHLSDRCNLECAYCLRESSPTVPVRHPASRFIELLDYLGPLSSPDLRITFTGGEPLMYPGFADVVRRSSDLGYRNDLLTNAVLITEKRAEFIADHFNTVQVSVDSVDPADHALGRGDNLSKVMRGLGRLATHISPDRDFSVKAMVTIASWNLESAQAMLDVLPAGVKIGYTPMFPYGRGADASDSFITNEQFLQLSKAFEPDGVPSPMYTAGKRSRSCHAGLTNLSIADTGDVYPCHLFHQPDFRFGNIFHDDFEGIFFGDRIRGYVDEMDIANNNTHCASCTIRYLCAGGCKANTLASTGNHHGPDLMCGFIKETVISNMFESVGGSATKSQPVALSTRS